MNKNSELSLIDLISRSVKNYPGVHKGIGDDCAVINYTKDKYLLLTSDMLVEGVDFLRTASPRDLGHKALACSLSDIAAMGGTPKYALVSLGLPKKNAREFIAKFYKGMSKLAGDFKVSIAGGDLSASEKIVIDVALVGEARKGRIALRSGAKKNDIIFISGPLGGSIYGRHLEFTPRVKEARYLVNNYKVNAMIDISDGLALDLYRMMICSNTGALIYEDKIKLHKDARGLPEAFYMGEDFELLFTMAAKEAKRLLRCRGNEFFPIGEVRDKKYGLNVITKSGRRKPLKIRGYQHFS